MSLLKWVRDVGRATVKEPSSREIKQKTLAVRLDSFFEERKLREIFVNRAYNKTPIFEGEEKALDWYLATLSRINAEEKRQEHRLKDGFAHLDEGYAGHKLKYNELRTRVARVSSELKGTANATLMNYFKSRRSEKLKLNIPLVQEYQPA